MSYTRADKIEWLKQTCSEDFLNNHLLLEMANWMGDAEFEKFYDNLCRLWDIKREECDPKFDKERDGDLG